MKRAAIVGTALGVLALAAGVAAQHHHHHHPPAAAKPAPPGARRVTMDELHRGGGVPRGWKFTLPSGGDPAKGRQVFADLECYKCHLIKGADFPPTGGDGKTGPELTGMGAHHPAEYFAESILSPNAVLLDGPGWIGADGGSIMPAYGDSLSVAQLVDLVAFIKSQTAGAHADHHARHHAHHGQGAVHERAIGPYRVRVAFRAHAQPGARATGHLMVFVTDAETGEAVPYLPVSAGVEVQGAATRVVKLGPMVGRDGFHYGADATLPPGTRRLVLTIGATTMHVMGADAARYARPQTLAFDWSAPAK